MTNFKKKNAFILVMGLGLMISYQNCSSGSFEVRSSPSQESDSQSQDGGQSNDAIDGVGEVGGTDGTDSSVSTPVPTSVPTHAENQSVIIDTKVPSTFSQYVPNSFTLFWPYPSRAHPGLPVDFQFIVYEAFKQPLTWELISGPSGMSLTSEGMLKWTPSSSQLGNHAVSIRVSRPLGSGITKSFNINVNTTDFIFVATTGNDSAAGAVTAPLATIQAALRSIQSGNGKTIYVRGGTYREHYNWEINGSIAPTRGKQFSADDPLIVSSYPGETFILDCEFQGHGLWAYGTSYVIFKNFESKNANAGERGGILVEGSENCVIQNVKVQDADWSHSANVAGVEVEAAPNTVIDRVTAINNRDKSSDHWNSSNYLFYSDGGANGDIYVLRSHSSNSIVGFKIKHAGPGARVIIHECTSTNDIYGFGGSSNYSSVRYSNFVNSIESGIILGITDPNSYTTGSMLLEHNTIYNFGVEGITFMDGYSGAAIVQKNIFANTGMSNRFYVNAWPYVTSSTGFRPVMDKNVFYAPGVTAGSSPLFSVRRVNSSLNQWQSQGLDAQSVVVNPSFIDTISFGINASSPAVFAIDEFAGSQQPVKP